MSEIDDMYENYEDTPNDDGRPRQGLMWVRKHNHEFVANGDESRPAGSGIVLRRYFTDLEEGISSWGRFGGVRWKIDKALDMTRQVANAESSAFRECFYVFEQGVPGEYLAIVMHHSRSGRLWLRKTAIHSAVKLGETVPTDAKNKKFYEHKFADYRELGPQGSTASRKRPVCQFSFLVIPYSGICECANPECEYSEA
jgi:hypothetical protein